VCVCVCVCVWERDRVLLRYQMRWYPYDVSICRYAEIMSSICTDLTARVRRKNGITNKGILPRNVALPLRIKLYPVVSKGLTITPYYVRHWSCHGIVDPPLLFFALVPDDRSCLTLCSCAAVAKKRSKRRKRRRREKNPLERNRGILAPRSQVVAALSLKTAL